MFWVTHVLKANHPCKKIIQGINARSKFNNRYIIFDPTKLIEIHNNYKNLFDKNTK